MGEQFRKFKDQPHNDAEWEQWLKGMSSHLDECTKEAALQGMIKAVEVYQEANPDADLYILPIRPLIVGGDDVTILIHCSLAIPFVQEVMRVFRQESKKYASDWCGTNGELTISAGILFAPVKHPLHSALNYAEMLLASAKTHGRDLKKKRQNGTGASPECLDWESVTESLLSTLSARRKDLQFIDPEDEKTVKLTQRPYSLDEFEKLEQLKESMQLMPGTLLHKFQSALYAPKSERLAFYAKISKNWGGVAKELREPWDADDSRYGKAWTVNGNTMSTGINDAVLLIEENGRMAQQTISAKED